MVPVKDASRTFGLSGGLDHIDMIWWHVHRSCIGVDGLEDYRSLEKIGTGGALVRTVYAKRPLDLLGRKESLQAPGVPTLFGGMFPTCEEPTDSLCSVPGGVVGSQNGQPCRQRRTPGG